MLKDGVERRRGPSARKGGLSSAKLFTGGPDFLVFKEAVFG